MNPAFRHLTTTLMPPEMRRELLRSATPIEVARGLFEAANLDFDAALSSHLATGYVVSRPTMFMMFRAIDSDGKHTWWISDAVGDLRELILALPFVLPYVAFTRRIDTRVRIYSLPKLIRKVFKQC